MCDIQLPFGRHHIHCYLFAPRGHKIDGYWHVSFVLLVLYAAPRTSTFTVCNFHVCDAEHMIDSTNMANTRQDLREYITLLF